jgi:Mn2+/Fe2+ NRAMP family transporter
MIWLRGRSARNEVIAGAEGVLPGETATVRAAHASLRGERKGLRALWPFLGPAFVAAVAYVDPGNFATNISGGAQFGYVLLWVILCSNLMAMLIQSMSAKLGIATGKNLPEVCRARFPRPVTLGLWVQAEIIAMAIAGSINASMLIMAAALFHANGLSDIGDIDLAFEQLRATACVGQRQRGHPLRVGLTLLGLLKLLGGTMSGQVVMQGFINRRIALWLRRLVTMLPALTILAVGLNPSRSLVISQVVLSFGIPFALIPLLIFCRNRDVMGVLVNRPLTTAVATVVVTLIVSLNAFLLYQTFSG